MSTVLVVADHHENAVAHSSLELITLARGLGDEVAVCWVGGTPDLGEFGEFGVSAVYVPQSEGDTESFGRGLAVPYAEAIAAVARRSQADLVLLATSFENKEIAARLGVELESGVSVDVSTVRRRDGQWEAEQSAFTGAYTVRSVVTHGTAIFAVKPNSVEASPSDLPVTTDVVSVPVTLSSTAFATEVVSRQRRPASGRPDLASAQVVVIGGRGVDGDFGPVEDLAEQLGAAVGATRVAVDEGWVEHTAQVGQTGVTVSPKLYIGLGVSGAVHHRAGMQSSQIIVAVNNDSDAPIFETVDFGVVGDVGDVVPQAIEEIKRRKNS